MLLRFIDLQSKHNRYRPKGISKKVWRKKGQELWQENHRGTTKVVQALAAFEKNGSAGDSNREKELLHGNGFVGTEKTQELVQIVHLNVYTSHRTNQENPTQGGFCDWLLQNSCFKAVLKLDTSHRE